MWQSNLNATLLVAALPLQPGLGFLVGVLIHVITNLEPLPQPFFLRQSYPLLNENPTSTLCSRLCGTATPPYVTCLFFALYPTTKARLIQQARNAEFASHLFFVATLLQLGLGAVPVFKKYLSLALKGS